MKAATLLRTSRTQADLTQRELALRTGVPQSTIARIERGLNDPRTSTLNTLLIGCGQLLTGSSLTVHSPYGFSDRAKQYLPTVVERIAKQFHPAQIVLFGSQAKGRAREYSDIDILVVFDNLTNKREMRLAIRKALADLTVDKDILVTTTEEASSRTGGPVVRTAIEEGVLLYGRQEDETRTGLQA
jgi:transcriptional regulator with XRE-family HTH domain